MTTTRTPWQSLKQRWQQVSRMQADEQLPSPCMSVCIMKTDTDECHGCLRTLNEIATWGNSSPAQHRQTWQRLGQRIEQHFHGS
jgi:predicted Fe-S protein YdhL (DUF1289 family)